MLLGEGGAEDFVLPIGVYKACGMGGIFLHKVLRVHVVGRTTYAHGVSDGSGRMLDKVRAVTRFLEQLYEFVCIEKIFPLCYGSNA